MTFRNFWIDLWLTIRYGKWVVERARSYESLTFGGSGGVNRWSYYACRKRTGDKVLCSDKREAEAFCAYRNDVRGM